jgi:hypothetical protein
MLLRGEPLSDLFAKPYRMGWAEGEALGDARGRAKGKARGRARGRAQSLVDALLKVLAARALVPTAEQLEAILECRGIPRLDRWLDAALVATSVDDVLGDSAPRPRP